MKNMIWNRAATLGASAVKTASRFGRQKAHGALTTRRAATLFASSGSFRDCGALLTAAFALCSPVVGHAEQAGPPAAKVLALTGRARYTPDGGQTWQMLNVGDVLRPGALIQTARTGARVDLALNEAGAAGSSRLDAGGIRVRLLEDTAVGLTRLAPESTELDLRSGAVLGVIKDLTGTAEFQVQFPGGIAGLRGTVAQGRPTVFFLNASGKAAVFEGLLVVASGNAQTAAKVVHANEAYAPSTGEVTALPKDAPERRLWPLERPRRTADTPNQTGKRAGRELENFGRQPGPSWPVPMRP